jgi:hypothetical protein
MPWFVLYPRFLRTNCPVAILGKFVNLYISKLKTALTQNQGGNL